MTVTNDLTIPGGSQHIAAKARLATLDELEKEIGAESISEYEPPDITWNNAIRRALAIIQRKRENTDG